MAYEIPGFVYGYMSSGDIRQFRAVSITGASVEEVGAADSKIDGIAQMPADDATAEVIRIMKSGISFAIAGGTVEAGDELATDDEGRLVSVTYEDNVVAKALTGGAVGEEISVLLL